MEQVTSKNLVLIGLGLLAIGLFVPIFAAPIVGQVNLLSNGYMVVAMAVIALMGVTVFLATRDELAGSTWTGAALAGVMVYVIARFEYVATKVRSELAGNPFGGLAQAAFSTVRLEWGWLVLGAGAAAIIYGGIKAHRGGAIASKAVIGASAALFLVPGAVDAYEGNWNVNHSPDTQTKSTVASTSTDAATTTSSEAPTAEEAAYIAQNLKLYDFTSKYYDTFEGHVPGVEFKIKNNGNRTLSGVTVKVVFYDNNDKPIAEQEYYPVTSGGFGDNNRPLKPNYIWQQDRDMFYQAKNVPTEWKEGKATASISKVEFAEKG